MAAQPLCPLALSLLAAGPRYTHEVASALAVGYFGARLTLERLRAAGLVRLRAGSVYAITRRGRSELALQRGLWALSAAVGGAAPPGH
jgi:DNA-binding PadR family transcriptional regulator